MYIRKAQKPSLKCAVIILLNNSSGGLQTGPPFANTRVHRSSIHLQMTYHLQNLQCHWLLLQNIQQFIWYWFILNITQITH